VVVIVLVRVLDAVEVWVLFAVEVKLDVAEVVAEVVAVLVPLVVCVEVALDVIDEDAVVVTVVRSHVRPDPSNKLSIAKFKADASSSHTDLTGEPCTMAPDEQANAPPTLFTNASVSYS